jgi:hypothetical protein
MKLKQFILAAVITVSVVSCSKQDIFVSHQTNTIQVNDVVTKSTITSESNNLAYIFIEPKSKQDLIVKYLKDSVTHSTRFPFLGFNLGTGITDANKNDVLNYINLKYWYNGQLPSVKSVNVISHNIDSLTINNLTINDNSVWVTIFIPVNAMNNDTYKQSLIKIGGTGLKTSIVTLNSTIYNYYFDYTGNYLPKGRYRLYTTFVSPVMRFDMSKPGNIFIKGNN